MTLPPEFSVIDDHAGRWIAITGPLSGGLDVGSALRMAGADGLVLGYAIGFAERTLEFIRDGWPVRRLRILQRTQNNLEPVYRLASSLESLELEVGARATLDLSRLPALQKLEADWSLIGSGVHHSDSLRFLSTWGYDGRDLKPLSLNEALAEIKIQGAARMISLEGLREGCSSLRIINAPALRDTEALAGVSKTLEVLLFDRCPGLEDLANLASCRELKLLVIGDCGRIASLHPLNQLPKLEEVQAWGSTVIADGDLSPLKNLPSLKALRMRPRKSYSPGVEDFPQAEL